MTTEQNASLDKFLTPESMLTPGVAGSMSMMIANALSYQFNMPNGWAILVLSFVFGLLVLANDKPVLTRTVLYVLNSLVVFCVAAGTATLSAGNPGTRQAYAFSLIRPAYAQSTTDLQAEYKKLLEEQDKLWRQLEAAPKGTNVTDLLRTFEENDRKRQALLRSIADAKNTTRERPFFAPLKF